MPGDPQTIALIAAAVAGALAAIAAIAQVVVATKIARLTQRLANDADRSTEAAAKDLDLALQALNEAQLSNRHARHEQLLAALPVFDVAEAAIEQRDSMLHAFFDVRNVGKAPAFDVRLRAVGETQSRQPEQVEIGHSDAVAVIGVDQQAKRVPLNLTQVLNMGARREGKRDYFSYDWMEVQLQAKGLLGGTITQRYEWGANFHPGTYGQWRLRGVELHPDPDDQQWAVQLAAER